jgi:hypothetical protein
MLEALAEQTQAEMVQDIQQEIERIYQELVQLEKHHHRRRPIKSVSKHEQPLSSPTTLKDVIENAIDQATKQEGLSQKKMWLLLAKRLEETHRLGIYKEPVNTICRFICLIHPTAKHNTIRKALPLKYKEPNQSKIAHGQMKGLTASIYRHHRERKEKKMASNNRYLQQMSEEGPAKKKIAINSVTPYKDVARSRLNYTFASWLKRCKKKKYNIGIFEKIKKDKAFGYICRDKEFALWYLEEVYHPSQKELSTVRKAMELFNRAKRR